VDKIENWTIAVEVLEGNATTPKTYTKTLNVSKKLKPGEIHKIKLPKFSSTEAWNPTMSKWITELRDYKNIYLTELSLPGAWYALGKEYQEDGHTAESLWNAGVRAFAVECRSKSPFKLLSDSNPNSVAISGTGHGHDVNGSYYDGTEIRTVIKSLADEAAATLKYDDEGNIVDGEFAVLVLSYADGGDGGHRSKDYAYFINGIKNEINNSGVLVPKATIVNDIINLGIFILTDVDDIPSTKISAPFISKTNPKIINIINLIMLSTSLL
jgi:hypothetical protein